MKPDKEKFKEEIDDIKGGKSDKVAVLATKYKKTPRTIYRWIDELIDGVPNIDEFGDDEVKTWNDWVEDYKDPEEEYPEYNQKFSLKNDSLIICMSDFHFGSKAIKKTLKVLNKHMKKIKPLKNVFIIFVGDLTDYGPAGPKGMEHDQQLKYKNQLSMAEAFIDEFGEKILAMATGCHSHFAYKVTGDFQERELAKKTYGGIFIGDGGILNLKVGQITYKVFMSHKVRGGSKRNPASGLFNIAMESIDFDVGVTAHRHNPAVTMRPLRDKQIHMINCGSYKGLDLFARKSGYAPVLNSTPCFYLDSKERKVVSFLDLEEGLEYMELKQCYTKTHS